MKLPIAGLLIVLMVVAAAVAFTVYCLVDLARAAEVRSLSRGVWAVICLASMPWGGIIYLMAGKVWPDREVPGSAPRWPMWHSH
jgi:hypothetical protein